MKGRSAKDIKSPPPIVEAVLDIRLSLADKTTPQEVEALHARIKDNYPIKKIQRLYERQIRFDQGKPVESDAKSGVLGFQFWNEEKTQIVQFRLNGFSFSRLFPYQNWKQFSVEAKRLWDIYRSSLPIQGIERLALRYINRLKIPKAKIDLSDYFTVRPKVPEFRESSLSNFLCRIQLRFTKDDIDTIITTTPAKDTPEGESHIIFDMDVFKATNLKSSNNIMWSEFDKLKEIRWQIFKDGLGKRAWELIT